MAAKLLKHVGVTHHGDVHSWDRTTLDVPADYIDKPFQLQDSSFVWECYCTLEYYDALQVRVSEWREEMARHTAEFWKVK